MPEDIRWKQRFSNFKSSLRHMELALAIEHPDLIQKAGLIQFFEISFELAWKVLKDYLEAQGLNEVKTPRAAIKAAFEIGIIAHGELWLEALQDRNLSSHLYDEQTSDQIASDIRATYYKILLQLEHTLDGKD